MMNRVVVIGVLFLMACRGRQVDERVVKVEAEKLDSLQMEQRRDSLAKEEEEAIIQEKYKKYWGYRFHITGDFNGDGKQETLTEKLISERTGQEIAKFCGLEKDTTADCYWTMMVNTYRQPVFTLHSSDPHIRDFVSDGELNSTIGLIFLQNTGDLNGDGTDEIVFVEDGGGCNSGIRYGQLATYKKGKWKVVLKYETRLGAYTEVDRKPFKTPNDLHSQAAKDIEKTLKEEPKVFQKHKGTVTYEAYNIASPVTKTLKPNW